jgi:spermidine synthase
LSNSYPRRLGLISSLPAFLLGFLATSYQIYLLRGFAAQFYGNELTFGFVFASWLFWGGLGSILAPRIRTNRWSLPLCYFGSLFTFLGILSLLRLSRFLLGTRAGELTGSVPALVTALFLGFFLSFPLGLFFVLNTRRLQGGVPRVYLIESLGAAAAGLLIHFIFIPAFSNWMGAALLVGISAPVIAVLMGSKRRLPILLTIWALAGTFALLDFPSQKLHWRPFDLTETKDTLYGKLQVIKTQEQLSFYGNGIMMFSHPDPAQAEEAVHFAMLQAPQARRVLLIGGGISGGCREILKYPLADIESIEMDPGLLRLAERYLPQEEWKYLRNPRIRIIHRDGRAHLRETPQSYDVILLSLPEPATARLNRFYTLEFFELVKKRLNRGGILSFPLPSSENYISRDLQEFLSSIFRTLEAVFPHVRIIPGDHNVFLASENSLETGAEFFMKRMDHLGIRNRFVRPGILEARLNPLRIESLETRIRGGAHRLNRDLVPISYYFSSILWATQFGSLEAGILKTLANLPQFWIVAAPVLFFGAAIIAASLRRKGRSFRYLLPVAIMGFTTILAEMSVLLVFQASFGSVYGKISLLLAAFMAGLFCGSLAEYPRKNSGIRDIVVFQGGFVLLLILMLKVLEGAFPEVLAYALLLALGFLGGGLFVAANRLFLTISSHPGLGYGLDLMGSFAGVLLATTIIIPLVGIPSLIKALLVLNLACFLFVMTFIPWRSRS